MRIVCMTLLVLLILFISQPAKTSPRHDGAFDGADVDAVNRVGYTRLMEASQRGDLHAMHSLIAAGADVNFMTAFGDTPLSEAARMGRAGAVKLLLDAGAQANLQLPDQYGALHRAAEYGQADCVELLLSHGANVNARGRYRRTPLIGAAASGNASPQVIRMLLDAGADLHASDDDGNTPKSEAALANRGDLLRAMECGSKP